jgi:NADPH:quinone reductase-like Zn-dependent oxidoreductase
MPPPAAPRCFPLEEAAEAHRLLESGRTTGTLVLIP